MLKIGLTGGIGSGKTTVAKIFEVLSIPVYYADEAARKLMNSDADLKNKILNAFGTETYQEGILNNTYLGSVVFKNPEKLAQLNSFVHPATLLDAESWIRKQSAPYIVKEAAIIFEAGLENHYDFIIGVTAPESLRIKRVIERDRSSSEKVLQRMARQMPDQEKMAKCDFVIFNDGEKAILPQVIEIHHVLLAKSEI